MGFIEISPATIEESRIQRWSHLLALAVCFLGLFIGLNFRNNVLSATTLYINNEAGIRASYPSSWIIDTDGSYVFRVRDISRLGFKTSIRIEIFPFTEDMNPVNVFDDLALSRAQVLSTYNVLNIFDITIDDVPATVSEYTYVFTEVDPFTEAIPIVVIGRDILIERRGQAILISFLTDADTVGEDIAIFEQFLETLEF